MVPAMVPAAGYALCFYVCFLRQGFYFLSVEKVAKSVGGFRSG